MNNLNWPDKEIMSLIMNQMNMGFIIAEYPSGKILEYNKASEDILGHGVIPASDVTEYAAYGGFKADGARFRPHEYPTARALLDGEYIKNEEMLYLTPAGDVKVLSINASPVYSPDGKRYGAVCTFHDITEKKASIGQVKLLIEESPYAVALFDNESRYLHLNSKLSHFNGIEIDQHIGKRPSDLFGETGVKVEEIIRKVKETKIPYPDFLIETTTPAHPKEVRTYCLQFYPVRLGQNLLGVGFFAEDITQRTLEQLKKDKEYVRTLSEKEQLTQFVNILSHDIRTPLGAIKFNAHLIIKNLKNEQKLISISHKISELTKKTDDLITDILDVNALSRGEVSNHALEAVDLNRCVHSCVEDFSTMFGDIFELNLGEVRQGFWNKTSIERILNNLTSNAIKYGHRGTKIKMTTKELDSMAIFEILNQGPEIPEEYLPDIFLPFKRLGNTTVGTKSYGLGLAIVKGLVESMNGQVSVTSTKEKGTVFTVCLPS